MAITTGSKVSGWLLCAAMASLGCGPGPVADPGGAAHRDDRRDRAEKNQANMSLLAGFHLPTVAEPEPDGENDGPVEIGPNLYALASAAGATLVALQEPPASKHPVVCDILGFGDALYLAHSVDTIDASGARIHRYDLSAQAATHWSLAFDWDRVGASPDAIGGVGGEGITRLRAIDGRIYAADADTPGPGGYRLSDARYEDYLFVSDKRGQFSPLGPGLTPPAGTRVMPMSFHMFDVISYQGALIASGGTGQYPSGPFPGGLWVGGGDTRVWSVRFELGAHLGVVRTTFMHRFGGRLYIGFQNNRRRGKRPARFDMAVLSGDPRDLATPGPVVVRVTPQGGWLTRRFASGAGTLYWVASRYRRGTAALFESTDGKAFARVVLPGEPGDVQDVAVVGDVVYVLTERGLYRARRSVDRRDSFESVAEFSRPGPFAANDLFCSAPLTAYADRLFAGSTVNGGLYEFRAR